MLTRNVGILGGGQLSQMLCEAGLRLDLNVTAFVEAADSPVTWVSSHSVVGDIHDRDKIENFLRSVEVVVFENEFIRTEYLKGISDHVFRPSLNCIQLFRDKLKQKRLLEALNVPVTDYDAFSGDLHRWLNSLPDRFPKGTVLKWGEWGYDGKGILKVNKMSDAVAFCETALKNGASLYAEEYIPFERELAMIGCLSITGEFATYPLVMSRQSDGICSEVLGPARLFGISTTHENMARLYAEKIAKEHQLYGVFALELFQVGQNLLVNEVAPRVHNSGHWTQDATCTSQFENHWRAVLGLPLGSTDPRECFVMRNVLGPEKVHLTNFKGPNVSSSMHLHWYNKSEMRPRRKLGHINATGKSADELTILSKEIQIVLNRWEETLEKK